MARLARESLNSGPDYFGEQQTLSNLASFLSRRGVEDEAINIQTLFLTAADTSLRVRVPAGENGDEPSAAEACTGADFGMGALAPQELDFFGVPAEVDPEIEIVGAEFESVAVKPGRIRWSRPGSARLT